MINNTKNKKKLIKRALKRVVVNNNNIMSTEYIKSIFPVRKSDSHKGDYGKVFIVGGSLGLTGAARFASEACIKCGSGLVTLGCPRSLNEIFEITLREVMTLPLEDESGKITKQCSKIILEKCQKSDALLFGCGIGVSDDITELITDIIKNVQIPIVIDADGINALSKNINILKEHKQPIILTPHIAEFSRLTGYDIDYIKNNTVKCALEFSKKHNVITVLKSHKTIVASYDGKYLVNSLGNAGMATGGSGDVLAGAIISFIGQGLLCFDSAVFGTFIHGLSGDISALEKGMHGMTPTDIIENIPYALKYLGG